MSMETFGVWIAVFLTLSIFSFLYKDNPFYKVAEHIFVGVSAGYWCPYFSGPKYNQTYSVDYFHPKIMRKMVYGIGSMIFSLFLQVVFFLREA